MNLSEFFIKRTRPLSNGCIEWTFHKTKDGYGKLFHKGKSILAHRFSYEVHVGEITNFYVLHKCDNPACVNPEHLFLGTQKDNVKDMVNKDRHIKHKITKQQALTIRNMSGSYTKIGALFNVSRTLVRHIKQNKIWT